MTNFIVQPDSGVRLGDYLLLQLQQQKWTHFRAAIAFVKQSGVRYLRDALIEFSRHATVKISVGIDVSGTSMEGLHDLLDCVQDRGEIWVYHNENNSTFHPKIYLFRNETHASVVIGSGNLTAGGLFTNYEASLATLLDLSQGEDRMLLEQIEATLNAWSDPNQKTALRLTTELIEQLVVNGYVPTEVQAREAVATNIRTAPGTVDKLFTSKPVPKPPLLLREERNILDEPEDVREDDFEIDDPVPASPQAGTYRGFLMTLQKTDVGRGQTTAGTSARSPEIFIPLSARGYDPDFWGWPSLFTADIANPGKMDRRSVRMRIGTLDADVNMMTWPAKHDFRLRSEALRSAGSVGDILRIERTDGRGGFTYYVQIIPQGTTEHDGTLALCVNSTPNSQKRWGTIKQADGETRLLLMPQHSF
jgi:HKD family nuclease